MAEFDVSVIIPAFNRHSTITDAIESCLASENLTIQILVVDDGSTDGTENIIRNSCTQWDCLDAPDGFRLQSGDSEIQYIFQENSGAPAARNKGLACSRSEFVKFLDSDDMLVEGALEKEVNFARENNANALVTGWIIQEITSGRNRVIDVVTAPDLTHGIDDMLEGRSPWTSAALYRHSAICHLKWDETVEKAQEWMWAWTVCLDGIKFSRPRGFTRWFLV